MRTTCGLMIVLAIACGAVADVLWDNDNVANGTSGRAISPPSFPNIRVAEDFVVPDGARWSVEDIHYSAVEDANWVWNDDDGVEVTIYDDDNSLPGKVIAQRTPGGMKTKTGRSFFGRVEYEYWAEFENDGVELGAGRYWISVRHGSATGVGTNYWLTSSGGEGRELPGAFSLNSGTTWQTEGGPTWHHAWVLTGREVPEPTSLALLALGGLAVLRRRR